MARLYVVSTPIGNLDDLTQRAADVLRAVDRILAEDTRRTRILTRHYAIDTPLVSAHEHNEAARAEELVAWLDAGDDVALVSDAGTPLFSDPGHRLVARALEAGHDVVPVPGPSAVLAALVASGFEPVPFTFLGFVPKAGAGRRDTLEAVAAAEHATVLFESPHRLVRLLRDLVEVCGPGRRVAVARELTKVHEEVVRDSLAGAVDWFADGDVKGEVVVVVDGARAVGADVDVDAVRALAGALLGEGLRPSAAAREVAKRLRVPRNRVYEIVQSLKEEDASGAP